MAEKHRRRRRYAPARRRSEPGAQPGLLLVDPESPRSVVSQLRYGPDTFKFEQDPGTKALLQPRKDPVNWINLEGLGDHALLESLARHYDLHPLAMEDVINVHQRPKLERYADTLFLVVRRCQLRGKLLETEQISFFLKEGLLLSFQEGLPGDDFEPVRRRIAEQGGPIRELGADYLLYALLDSLIDSYFPLLENYGERLAQIEDLLLAQPRQKRMAELHLIRRDLHILRRNLWPLRDLIHSLQREDLSYFGPETQLHLRDCYDHLVQLLDWLEMYRELCASLTEFSLSSMSQRMNEIMQFLTIMSSIFIPLTLIAGIYGMNFNPERSPWNMPELNWVWGYPFALGLMLVVALALLIFFRWRGWLGLPRDVVHVLPEEVQAAARPGTQT